MKVVSSKEILKNRLFTVTEEHAVDPDGFEIHRSIIRHPGSAVMMAVDDKHQVLMVRQFRLPASKSLWELPAGRLDPRETPLQAAKRELREETGYSARKWTKLASFWPSPGYVAEKMNLFLAEELKAGPPHPMDDERIECRWFSLKELVTMVASGAIEDGKTLVGYYMWKERLRQDRGKLRVTRK
jgi:ADP-ribose pyrophosphatase